METRKVILLSKLGLYFFFFFLTVAASSSIFGRQQAQLNEVTGVVSDTKGKPIAGATVTYHKGKTTTSVVTNDAGRYKLSVSDLTGKLVISSKGVATQTIPIQNRTSIDVSLEEESEHLDEVVVSTGYQKISRKLFTGAAVSLRTKDVKLEGVADATKFLEGRVAGVSLQSPSATFGAAPRIRVRGTTSITGNSTPLFVIDGVVLENLVDISTSDLSSGNANTILGSSIAGLNAEDISSFQILKDASATSIYGARAKNGVVLITTKGGGFAQKPTVTYSSTFNFRQRPTYANYNIMNSADQMDVLVELSRKGYLNLSKVYANATSGVFGIMYDKFSYDPAKGGFGLPNNEVAPNAFLEKYARANTDWFDILFKNSIMQTHSLSFSAGGENSSFYSSVSYMGDAGQTIADNVDRLTVMLKETVKIKDRFTFGVQFNGSIRNQRTPTSEALQSNEVFGGTPQRTFDINPYLFAMNTSRAVRAYDDDGNYEYVKKNFAPFNILEETKNNYTNLQQLDMFTRMNFGWEIIKGLKYEFTGSARYNSSVSKQTITEYSNYAQAYRANENQQVNEGNVNLFTDLDDLTSPAKVVLPVGGFFRQTTNTILNYYVRNTLTWNKKFGSLHEVNVFVGQDLRYIDRTYSHFTAPAVQYDNGLLTNNFSPLFYEREKQIGGGVLQLLSSSAIPRERALSYFVNLAYNFDERYTINLTGRYDGSNRLGLSKNARWLPTWNVSAAWNVLNESFFTKSPSLNRLFSQLRLRMTYGLTANTATANNATAVFTPAFSFRVSPNTRENSINIDALQNSNLTWEKQYEYNVGLDLGLWDDKISLVWDVYFRQGFDVIGVLYTSGVGGQVEKYGNYANTHSNGTEVSLSFNDILGKLVPKLHWSANIIMSYNQSGVDELKYSPQINDLVQSTGGSVVGRPISALYSIVFRGLDANGLPTFTNESGETGKNKTVYFQSRDIAFLKYEGPIVPPATGGFSNTFHYAGFDFNIFFSYQFGNKVRIPFRMVTDDISAATTQWQNRWVLPKDDKITIQPAFASTRVDQNYGKTADKLNGAYALSSETVADGGFVRLKSVSLGYTFPSKWVGKVFKNLNLRLSATNLLVLFSDHKLLGLDPEFVNSGGVALPIQAQYTLSINATL